MASSSRISGAMTWRRTVACRVITKAIISPTLAPRASITCHAALSRSALVETVTVRLPAGPARPGTERSAWAERVDQPRAGGAAPAVPTTWPAASRRTAWAKSGSAARALSGAS
ncbi:hypothetical protein SR39_23610 [Methylobacterium radiotolerans]|nr:hypothetical protein SR39_23610 [Methylobacterium radiotolerans]